MTSYGLSHGAVVPDLSIFSAPIRLCAARPSGCRGGGPWARQNARMASVNVHIMLSGLILADTTHVKTDPPSICVECFGWRRCGTCSLLLAVMRVSRRPCRRQRCEPRPTFCSQDLRGPVSGKSSGRDPTSVENGARGVERHILRKATPPSPSQGNAVLIRFFTATREREQ